MTHSDTDELPVKIRKLVEKHVIPKVKPRDNKDIKSATAMQILLAYDLGLDKVVDEWVKDIQELIKEELKAARQAEREKERERIFNETAGLRVMYGKKDDFSAYKLVNDTIRKIWLVLGAKQNKNGDFELTNPLERKS